MICKPCRRGGTLNKILVTRYTAAFARRITNWHSKCKGGTWCDCQHKHGLVINSHA